MARPTRISDIREFTDTGRIPEAAITKEILENVGQVNCRDFIIQQGDTGNPDDYPTNPSHQTRHEGEPQCRQ